MKWIRSDRSLKNCLESIFVIVMYSIDSSLSTSDVFLRSLDSSSADRGKQWEGFRSTSFVFDIHHVGSNRSISPSSDTRAFSTISSRESSMFNDIHWTDQRSDGQMDIGTFLCRTTNTQSYIETISLTRFFFLKMIKRKNESDEIHLRAEPLSTRSRWMIILLSLSILDLNPGRRRQSSTALRRRSSTVTRSIRRITRTPSSPRRSSIEFNTSHTCSRRD